MEPRNQRGHLERTPRLTRGSRALLFERLCQVPGPRVRDAREVAVSVRRELARLLNTRLPLAAGMTDESRQTVINYGLPDFSLLCAASPQDRDLLARLIEGKIGAFEPRLRAVRVALEPDSVEFGALTGTMQAWLETESISERVSFPLSLGSDGVVFLEGSAPDQ